jgi:hypothetical protein
MILRAVGREHPLTRRQEPQSRLFDMVTLSDRCWEMGTIRRTSAFFGANTNPWIDGSGVGWLQSARQRLSTEPATRLPKRMTVHPSSGNLGTAAIVDLCESPERAVNYRKALTPFFLTLGREYGSGRTCLCAPTH